MKPRISKDLIIFLILIPAFLWGAFYISSRMENRLPTYSVVNKARTGCSIYYEALKELGYNVERTVEPIDQKSSDSIQLVAQNGSFDINGENVKQWVEKGGVLVYLAPSLDLTTIEYGAEADRKGYIIIYNHGKGHILTAEVTKLTNKALMDSTLMPYELLEALDRYPHERIVFNEAHLYAAIYKKSLWDYIPLPVIIIYQLIVLLIGYFYLKGKRFGKPIPLYDEVERTENEYLYSAASLYRQAKCWDLMLENYYKDFLRQLGKSHEGWLEYWEKENLPAAGKAKLVYQFMHSSRNKVKVKEYISIVSAIEQLKGIIKKRRDTYWKTLRKTT